MPARGLIVLLCLLSAANTVSVGAFPALLPELATAGRLADWQLGAVAGVFGFARMLSNVPAGLFMTHHLVRGLVAAPGCVLAGALLMALGGGSFASLLVGRALMGLGHTLSTLGALTAILRHRAGPRLASSLSAMEFAAMLGVLSGAGLLALLPPGMPWHVAWLLACAPVMTGAVLLPLVARALPARDAAEPRPFFARSEAAGPASGATAAGRGSGRLAALAVVAGGAVAIVYSTVEQFIIPLRGSREFGLERSGIARLLMLSQAADLTALLPLGALADRRGTARVLGVVFLLFAVALGLVGFAGLTAMTVGCVVFGVCMAGWMLPLGLLRAATPPAQVAWRTALYRVSVDGGMFAGPFVAGLLSARYAGVVPAVMTVVMAAVGLALLTASRGAGPSR